MATRTATQLTITIPDGAPPGSILSIPVKGRSETIKARVPEGLGAGSTLVLTQQEGSDEWIEDASMLSATNRARQGAMTPPVVPGAVVGLDFSGTGKPDLVIAGPDSNQDGIPDALTHGIPGLLPPSPTPTVPGPPEEGLVPDGPVAYTVRLDTTAGVVDIIVRPDWAPYGARRFLELSQAGDLDGLAIYRAVKGCLAQFGLPAKRALPPLPDDPPTSIPFLLGAVCFAAIGKNSRKSTLFICIGDMSHCFGQSPWETPIGAVAEPSLPVLERIETCYGDIAECGGHGPDTGRINAEGDSYLRANFPNLTYIRSAVPLDWPPAAPARAAMSSQLPAAPEIAVEVPAVATVQSVPAAGHSAACGAQSAATAAAQLARAQAVQAAQAARAAEEAAQAAEKAAQAEQALHSHREAANDGHAGQMLQAAKAVAAVFQSPKMASLPQQSPTTPATTPPSPAPPHPSLPPAQPQPCASTGQPPPQASVRRSLHSSRQSMYGGGVVYNPNNISADISILSGPTIDVPVEVVTAQSSGRQSPTPRHDVPVEVFSARQHPPRASSVSRSHRIDRSVSVSRLGISSLSAPPAGPARSVSVGAPLRFASRGNSLAVARHQQQPQHAPPMRQRPSAGGFGSSFEQQAVEPQQAPPQRLQRQPQAVSPPGATPVMSSVGPMVAGATPPAVVPGARLGAARGYSPPVNPAVNVSPGIRSSLRPFGLQLPSPSAGLPMVGAPPPLLGFPLPVTPPQAGLGGLGFPGVPSPRGFGMPVAAPLLARSPH